ncbi:DUF4440 domain-containing protein [Angustibacter aerolatus]
MSDVAAVQQLVDTFFDAFTSGTDLDARLDGLTALFVPWATVVRLDGTGPTVYDVQGFVEPRRALLAGGTLTGFREWEVQGRTDVFGDLAQHWCTYAKEWTAGGTRHTGRGAKSLQLLRSGEGWRITSLVWDDER